MTNRIPASAAAALFVLQTFASAESVSFRRADDENRVCQVTSHVTTSGQIFTSGGGGKTFTLDLTATADFSFAERRLAPAGREALSLRAVRDFAEGRMETTVGERVTRVELPTQTRMIVALGQTGGVTSYSPQGPLSRESLDLLELPGDPLALSAILPSSSIEIGATWTAPEWAAQMLGAVEAIERSELTCKLDHATAEFATVSLDGLVTGQRQGANCEIKITGKVTYDRGQELISAADLAYTVKSAVGAANPGVEATVQARMQRTVLNKPGRLTDELVAGIPIATEERSLDLVFAAAPWGMQLRHSRDWFLFHAVLEGSPQVAIFRLIDRGSLIAQCNMAPIPPAAAGQTTPLEQFEADIRASLGPRLKEITAREQVDVGPSMKVFRVVVAGEYSIKSPELEEIVVPTNWIYYLCAAPSGQQASFVFAVEAKLREQLGDKDEQLVRNLQFAPADITKPARAAERNDRAKP